MADIAATANFSNIEKRDEKGVGAIGTGSIDAHDEAHGALNTLTNRRYPEDNQGKVVYDFGEGSTGDDNWYRLSETKTVVGTGNNSDKESAPYSDDKKGFPTTGVVGTPGSIDVDGEAGRTRTNTGTIIIQEEVTLEGGILVEVRDSSTGKFIGASQNRRYQKHFYPGTVFKNLAVGNATSGTFTDSDSNTVTVSYFSKDEEKVHVPTVKTVMEVLRKATGQTGATPITVASLDTGYSDTSET